MAEPSSPRLVLVLAAVLVGCAASEPIDLGASSSGGTSEASGSNGSGGDSGNSSSASGGNTGSGGSASSAGTTGSGGLTGTGGTTGSGGLTGSGGTTGTAGAKGGAAGRGGLNGAGAAGRGGTAGGAGTRGKGGGGAAGTIGSAGASGTAPTFTQIYNTILTVSCAGAQCHDPGYQSNVSFASQSSAYSSVQSLVTAGNATGSTFYMIVKQGSMPPGGPKLSATNLQMIADWINAGALDD